MNAILFMSTAPASTSQTAGQSAAKADKGDPADALAGVFAALFQQAVSAQAQTAAVSGEVESGTAQQAPAQPAPVQPTPAQAPVAGPMPAGALQGVVEAGTAGQPAQAEAAPLAGRSADGQGAATAASTVEAAKNPAASAANAPAVPVDQNQTRQPGQAAPERGGNAAPTQATADTAGKGEPQMALYHEPVASPVPGSDALQATAAAPGQAGSQSPRQGAQGSEPSKAPAGEKGESPPPSGSGRSGDSPAPPSTLAQTASPTPISLARPGQEVAASGQAASHPSRPAEGEKEAKPQAKGQAPTSPDSVVSPSPGHTAVAAQAPALPQPLEPAQAAPSPVAPAPVEARDILGQVIGRVKVSVSGERTEARIHLVPEQLGPVDLKVSMEGGQLTARFHVATGQVKEILEQHLPELKQALHDQGFRIEQFSVTMGAGTTAQDAGNGHQAAAWQNQAGRYGRYGRYREEPAAVLATMEGVRSAGARAGGLDLMA